MSGGAALFVGGAALAVALALRPWRLLAADAGPPWPWVVALAALPLLWGAQQPDAPAAVPMSGAALLVLLAGWPLAVIGLAGVAVVHALAADLGAAEAVHSYAALGVVPATLAFALGAAVRRWLPRHPASYVVGRGFVVTLAAAAAAGALLLEPGTAGEAADAGLGDAWLAHAAIACAEAWLTAIVVACCVAGRPEWLATYADRLYLPAAAAAQVGVGLPAMRSYSRK